MKTLWAVVGAVSIAASLSSCSAGPIENTKSDLVACKDMNYDAIETWIANDKTKIARLKSMAKAVSEASLLAESSLLLNLMADKAQSIESLAVSAEGGIIDEDTAVQLGVQSFQDVISACESVE